MLASVVGEKCCRLDPRSSIPPRCITAGQGPWINCSRSSQEAGPAHPEPGPLRGLIYRGSAVPTSPEPERGQSWSPQQSTTRPLARPSRRPLGESHRRHHSGVAKAAHGDYSGARTGKCTRVPGGLLTAPRTPLRPLWSGSAFTHGSDAREAQFLARWPSGALLGRLRLPGVFLYRSASEWSILAVVELNTTMQMPGAANPGHLPFPRRVGTSPAGAMSGARIKGPGQRASLISLPRTLDPQRFTVESGHCAAYRFGQGRPPCPSRFADSLSGQPARLAPHRRTHGAARGGRPIHTERPRTKRQSCRPLSNRRRGRFGVRSGKMLGTDEPLDTVGNPFLPLKNPPLCTPTAREALAPRQQLAG
jgi:hypothetical protein